MCKRPQDSQIKQWCYLIQILNLKINYAWPRLKGRGATKFEVSGAYLEFNTKVSMKSKVKAYDTFQFVIDVGSSLGLWIGLSVLGLIDFLLDSFEYVLTFLQTQKFK